MEGMKVAMKRVWAREQAVDSRTIAMAGVMLAFVFVMTRVPQVPVGPSGYIHLGDAAIYVAAFLFGPIVGVFAAAFGTMFSDLSAGYGAWAPGSFVIHGLQALVAGVVAWRGGLPRMIAAAVVGGAIVVVGYFLYQWIALGEGLGAAGASIWPNTFQVIAGAVIGIPLSLAVLRAYPPAATFGRRPTWQEEPGR
jgi:energy-coupling factor transport system substrate-specific component